MIVPSIRALAAVLGISHTALNKRLKTGRFQGEPGGGFDPEKVRAALGQKGGAAPSASTLEAPSEGASKVSSDVMQIEMWPTGRPKPYGKNARKWSDSAIRKVAASIREFGFRQPIVVDAEGVVIIGHLRLQASKSLQLEEVPVHVASDLTPAQVKGLRIADNRTSQESAWDLDLLGPELLELKVADFDLGLTGFEMPEILASVFPGIEAAKKSKSKAGGASPSGYKEQYGVIVICQDETAQAQIFEKLTAEGYACKIVVT